MAENREKDVGVSENYLTCATSVRISDMLMTRRSKRSIPYTDVAIALKMMASTIGMKRVYALSK